MSSKRGPSVLVTDARERADSRSPSQRPGTSSGVPARGRPMKLFSVDNVLQNASEIPSGQPRLPPGPRSPGGPLSAARTLGRRVTAGGLPTLASARTGQQNVPSRTTKVSEKLVLLPETIDEVADEDEDALDGAEEAARRIALAEPEDRPLKDEELDVLKKRGGVRGKSYAERLPKQQRAEKFSRVTAYCTAQAFKMKASAEFLRTRHEAKTKLYDDCLYVVYHLPLLSGTDGYRLRSRPILKTPGTGKTVLDLEIERSERRDEHEGYFEDYGYGERGGEGGPSGPSALHQMRIRQVDGPDGQGGDGRRHHHGGSGESPMGPMHPAAPEAKNFGEMFLFSYGVVVFWNFTEHQEKDILADLTFAESEYGMSLVTRPLDQSDYETEEFHFEYSPDARRPRVFNDMITLLPRSDHMVKLTISHAIAQSTKLCLFEEKMSQTMLDAQHVPKRLALTGQLNMTRTEIVKILGRLFTSRVDINLSSNVLDVPNFFWDSEPTLHPLYVAIRDYLEIEPRIKVLNERLRVFLDLAEILSDSVADAKMSAITWIVIILIVVSIIVTVTEVGLRFGILSKEKGKGARGRGAAAVVVAAAASGGVAGGAAAAAPGLARGGRGAGGTPPADANVTLEDLRAWAARLSEQERSAVCGAGVVGRTFAGV